MDVALFFCFKKYCVFSLFILLVFLFWNCCCLFVSAICFSDILNIKYVIISYYLIIIIIYNYSIYIYLIFVLLYMWLFGYYNISLKFSVAEELIIIHYYYYYHDYHSYV